MQRVPNSSPQRPERGRPCRLARLLTASTLLVAMLLVPLRSPTVAADADIEATVSGPTIATAGEQITYTYIIENRGTATATDVEIENVIPYAILDATIDSTDCPEFPCTVSVLGPGDVITIMVKGTIDPATRALKIANDLIVNWPPEQGGRQLMITQDTTINRWFDAGVTVTPDRMSVYPGEQVAWTIEVTNHGPSADGFTLESPLPPNVLLDDFGVPDDALCDELTCEVSFLPVGDTRTFSLTGTVSDTFAGTLTHTATVTPFVRGVAGDLVPDNNTASGSVDVVTAADLTVTAAGPATVVAGNPITWTLNVTNDGPTAASAIDLALTLPDGVTGMTVDGAGCTALPCVLATLPASSTAAVTVTGTVDPSYADATLPVTATVVSSTPEPGGDPGHGRSAGWTTSVTTAADLGVTKTPVSEPVTAGETAAWDIVVVNNGPSTARNLTITDTASVGLTGIALTGPSGVDCSGTVCSLDSLLPGAANAVTLHATGAVDHGYATDEITNAVEVASLTSDPTSANNRATSNAAVVAEADVSVTMSATGASVLAGQSIGWTAELVNDGPSTARGVVVSLDATGVVLGDVTAPDGMSCNAQHECAIGDLAPGTPLAFTVAGEVPASFLGTSVSATATATSDTADPDAANGTAESVVSVTTSADLAIDATGPDSAVSAGESISWTIEVRNGGPSVARDVVISQSIPPAVTGIAVASADTGCTSLPCSVPSLDPGDAATLTVTGTIDPAYTGVTIDTTASVTAATTDPALADNTASEHSAVVHAADVSVTVQPHAPEVVPGGPIAWDVTVTNAGPATARATALTSHLPSGVTIDTVQPSQGTCADPTDDGELVCELGELSSAPVTIAIAGVVGATTQGTLTHSVDVTSGDDTDPSDNAAEATVAVTPVADLTLTVDALDDAVAAGTRTAWSVAVTNAGPGLATGVHLVVELPDGLDHPAADGPPAPGIERRSQNTWLHAVSGPGCAVDVSSITCAVGDLAVGDSFTITVSGDVAPIVRGALRIAASVSSDVLDLHGADNATAATTQVTATTGLSVTVAVDDDTVTVGEPIVYTVTVANAGPSSATDVAVTGALPAGATLVSSSSPDFDATTGSWSVGDLAPDDTKTLTLTVQPGVAGTAVYAAQVSSAEQPSGPAAEAVVNVVASEPPTTVPVPTVPSPTVPPGGSLPNTGSRTPGLVGWSIALLAAGMAVHLVSRRRQSGVGTEV